MGDRRIADRRAAEEGVVKIETKKLVIYIIIGLIIIALTLGNIILGTLYSNYKNAYEALLVDDYDTELDTEQVSESYDDNTENICELLITEDKEYIAAGETITLELKATQINAATGITMFETLLNYDSDMFECEIIDDENIEWQKIGFVDKYCTMARNDLTPSTEDQVIAKIAIKAKENIEPGQYTFGLSQIKFTLDDDQSFYVPDENKVINVL